MPRDSNGLYILPEYNPVADGDIIEALWANTTMQDFAIQFNNVLTRDGLLGFTDPVYLVNGSALLPAMAFVTQPNLGIFRDGINALAVASSGVTVAKFSNEAVDSFVPLGFADGTEAAPSLRFTSDTGTGLYYEPGDAELEEVDVLGLSVSGVGIVDFSNIGVRYYRNAVFPRVGLDDGTAEAPALGWETEPNTGLFHAPGALAFSVQGVNRGYFTVDGLVIVGKLTAASIDSAGAAVLDSLTVKTLLCENFLANPNGTVANLFIGDPIASGLFQRSGAHSVSLRTGDHPNGPFKYYAWNNTEFASPGNVTAANKVVAYGSHVPQMVNDPGSAALTASGAFGGGLILNAGVDGFLAMYLLAGGAGRLRAWGGSNDYTFQHNSDGSFYAKAVHGYYDATHYCKMGWDGSSVLGAFMVSGANNATVYLDGLGNLILATMGVVRAYYPTTGGMVLNNAVVPHVESGVKTTDANGRFVITFSVPFASPSVTFCHEGAVAKWMAFIVNRTATFCDVLIFDYRDLPYVGATINWIAVERTQ